MKRRWGWIMFCAVLISGISCAGCAHTNPVRKPAGGHRTVNRPAKFALGPCVGKQWVFERAKDAGLR